jgi:hypothetical protein
MAAQRAAGQPPGRVYNEFRVAENYGMTSHMEDVWGASPLRLAAYVQLFDQFPLDRMWALLGVEYVMTWRRELFAPSELLAEFPQANDTTYLHRIPEPFPRAWSVNRLEVATNADVVAALADHRVDLARFAFVSQGTNALESSTSLPEAFHSVRVDQLPAVEWADAHVQARQAESGTVWVQIESAEPAFVVISENWMPGRQVMLHACESATTASCTYPVNDPVSGLAFFEPLPVNLTLTGVAVPPGRFEFTLDYSPVSARMGYFVTIGSLGVILILMGSHLLWQRRGRQAHPARDGI